MIFQYLLSTASPKLSTQFYHLSYSVLADYQSVKLLPVSGIRIIQIAQIIPQIAVLKIFYEQNREVFIP